MCNTLLPPADFEHEQMAFMSSDFAMQTLPPGDHTMYAPTNGMDVGKGMVDYSQAHDLEQLHRDLGISYSF